MQRGQLKVTDRKMETNGGRVTFSLRGNGIKFHQAVNKQELKEQLPMINENFANNLRYIKHMGGFPDDKHYDPKAMMHDLKSKWSQTATGIAIRPYQDPLPEFQPFTI